MAWIPRFPASTIIPFSGYDIDLPDVIAIRQALIPETARSHCIAQSIFDMTWVPEIPSLPDGILFIAGGVLPYFPARVVKHLLSQLADHFAGGEIIFDTVSQLGKFLGNRIIKSTGMKSAVNHWALSNATKLLHWDGRLELVEQYPLFSRIPRDATWGNSLLRTVNQIDKYHVINMVHLKFRA